MGKDARREFQYRPPDVSTGSLRRRLLVETIRSWFFSPVGLAIAWLLALALLSAAFVAVVVSLHERITLSLLTLGMWWLCGVVVIHWWIPAARSANERTEGIAAAGWHVVLTMSVTGLIAWLLLFPEGLHSPFTLRDTWPVIASWIIVAMASGAALIWLRGHTLVRTLRYGVFAGSIGAAWMSLWLVAAHAGL